MNYSKFGFAVTLQPEENANNAQIPLPENHINEIINSYIQRIPEDLLDDVFGMTDINIYFKKLYHNDIAAILGQPLINPPLPPINAFICRFVPNDNYTDDSPEQFLGAPRDIVLNGRNYILSSFIIPQVIIDAIPE